MKIRLYQDLQPNKITGFAKFRKAIENDNFTQADVRKIDNNLYRARLNRSDRLLFSLHSYAGETWCLVLEYLPNHGYEKSRFLRRGVSVDEDKIAPVANSAEAQLEPLVYLNPGNDRFQMLDKVLSFDDEQQAVYDLPPPLVVIGSAGSGKTALTLEKMKHAVGDVLYVSLSPFLVQTARNLYYANGYSNDDQEIDFLSFKEFLESIKVPPGREITLKEFEAWFQRHNAGSGLKDAHTLFEEFRGVITGPATETAWLSREDYLRLGIKQSIFTDEQRGQVYDLFERYLQYLEQAQRFDASILSHKYLAIAERRYDFVVVDEVQDLTNIQLYLVLQSLRNAGDFLLCGDANQIVHPNFFSWSKVKTLFFEDHSLTGHTEVLRVLHANYRNSPLITAVANRLLKLKHARFGSIDKESNYLVSSTGEQVGSLQLLEDSDAVKRDLDAKTGRSTRFAVLVMHPDQKAEAQRWFNTPLVFSIQEAKGLEYDSIILFNFISGEDKVFRHIAAGVDPEALDNDDLTYGRAKDKRDKSLEVYKFFINALYVAMTRAVRNLYMVETRQQHPIIELLQLARFSGELALEKQASSMDEWQKEARKLELQGKQEQAEAIQQRILQRKKVPWPVLDRAAFGTLQEKALVGNNKKDRLLAFEYALLYQHRPTLNALAEADFKATNQKEEKSLKILYRKHFLSYDLNNPGAVLRDTEKYGIDHRTVFNLTPLMVAARLGNGALAEALMERGADPNLIASNGLNALQLSLELALSDRRYAQQKAARIYPLLAAESLSIQVDGRLIKLDNHLMGLFILNIMFAMFYRQLGDDVATGGRAFSAKALTEWVQHLPPPILPERRKKQAYISSVLSGNEVSRDAKYNRKLFLRLSRGQYIINPNLKLRVGEDWLAVHELLRLEDMGFKPAQPVVHNIPGYHWESSAEYLAMRNKRMGAFLEFFRQQVRSRIVDEEVAASSASAAQANS